MKTLTPTLEAAQKSPHRLPCVKATVSDLYQGVKRLSWERLYSGTEAQGQHDIAFDDQGAMWRLRVDGTNLYRQRITNPGPTSNYSTWELVLTECEGPCAITASGSRVYIFCRTTSSYIPYPNAIIKIYTHDYGSNWDDELLVDYADVLSLAACWWGTSSTVICFALKADEINGIRLDTDTQVTSQKVKSYTPPEPIVITNTYGIGATYDSSGPRCNIVFAGKQSASPYNHHNLFRTWFSDLWSFGALESFLMAPDGEDLTFHYPDVHLPASAQSYETSRVTLTEKFAGTTAYTRPLACHVVPGTDWTDTTFTEPAPLLDIAPDYGLRLATTSAYWWMEMPSGVWRAARAPMAAIDLSPDITSLTVNRPGTLGLELNNSKGQYSTPGAGALASLRFRARLDLELGYRTSAGDETLDFATLWIESWEYTHGPGRSLFIITATDGWGLLRSWTPRHQLRWNKDASSPRSVWQIMYRVLARVGLRLTTDPPQPRSSAIDNFYPDFTITPGTAGDTVLRRLLALVPDRLMFLPGGLAQTKDPRPTEASAYSYGPDAHRIFQGSYRHAVTLSRARALGRDASADRLVHDEFDWDLLHDGIDILEQAYDPNLDVIARLEERALAILRLAELQATPAAITTPANVGLEPYDVIDVTDPRCGISARKFRVLGDRIALDRRRPRYQHTLTLGAR